jgi:hypothetical protein
VCIFESERAVLVCDVTIVQVRRDAERAFGDKIRCTVVRGQGTRIDAADDVEPATFEFEMRAAIAAALAETG